METDRGSSQVFSLDIKLGELRPRDSYIFSIPFSLFKPLTTRQPLETHHRRRRRNILRNPDDPIAAVTSAALVSADLPAPGNKKYAVFGISTGHQNHTITYERRW